VFRISRASDADVLVSTINPGSRSRNDLRRMRICGSSSTQRREIAVDSGDVDKAVVVPPQVQFYFYWYSDYFSRR
jgi:hypothetical protein